MPSLFSGAKPNLMRTYIFSILALVLVGSTAAASLEGTYRTEDGLKEVRLVQFGSSLTMNTVSYYHDGSAVNWFYEFVVPANMKADDVVEGRVRSLDGYYGCVFDEKAYLQKDPQGQLKIRQPLLSYHRETRSIRDDRYNGHYYEYRVDWTGWGWVESGYRFPIERWKVISSKCVIDQRNWVNSLLIPIR